MLLLSSDSLGARTQDPILKRDVLYRLSYLVSQNAIAKVQLLFESPKFLREKNEV